MLETTANVLSSHQEKPSFIVPLHVPSRKTSKSNLTVHTPHWICRKGKSKKSSSDKPKGRGRAAKRSTLYDAMRRYRDHFYPLLTAELEAEQRAVLELNKLWGNSTSSLRNLLVRKRNRLYSLHVFSLTTRQGVFALGDKFRKGDLLYITTESSGSIEEDRIEANVLARRNQELLVTVGIGTEGAMRLDQFERDGIYLKAECGTNSLAFERALAALAAVTKEGAGTSDISRLLVMSFIDQEVISSIEHEHCEQLRIEFRNEGQKFTSGIPNNKKLGEVKHSWNHLAKETASRISPSYLDSTLRKLKKVLNTSQISAVRMALTQRLTLIQGPPGTGKTVTAANLILCALELNRGPVLACSSSNVAADNLLQKIISAGTNRKVVRIGRVSAIDEELWNLTLEGILEGNPVLKKAREQCSNGTIRISDLKDAEKELTQKILREADVVVATCVTCGAEFMNDLLFPIVLIDEATQATEPDVLIPMRNMLQGGIPSQLILVGDQNQLPPTTLSRNRSPEWGIGLETSLFLRLYEYGVDCEVLNVQYRMHPVIAAFPAARFYSKRLRNGITAENRPLPTDVFESFEESHRIRSRVLFCNVRNGEEESRGYSYDGIAKSKSYFNQDEAQVVLDIVKRLLSTTFFNASDIGIISPYSAQVKLLNETLRKNKSKSELRIEVSTIDGFQGREKEVIILSTVRNNRRREVGFLRDWRRLNVAITRARTLLIVAGDESTIATDENWRRWLGWVRQYGARLSISEATKG